MIPLMKNAFLNENATRKALAEFVLSGELLSMGAQCQKFEKNFAKWQGCQEAVLFNSGGSANLAMLQALKNMGKLKDEDGVLFSALTWSTNVMPIIQMGLTPYPVDVCPTTLNIDITRLDAAIARGPGIKALFITNALGFTGPLEGIRQWCLDKNILLLEDNCESLGTTVKIPVKYPGNPATHTYKKAGNFGLCSSFSFFVAHHMSTIEGGMVCTGDEELADMLRIVRANGWDRNLTAEKQIKIRQKHGVTSDFQAKYTFYELGYNLRPTEITGFLGNFQLQFLAENIALRQHNYLRFLEIMKKNDDFIILESNHLGTISTFALPVVCKTKELRDYYVSRFAGAGIETRPMIAGNMVNQPFYKRYAFTNVLPDLSGTDFLDQCSFYCGNHPDLTENDIQVISSCLYKL